MAVDLGFTDLPGWQANTDFPGIKLPEFEGADWQRVLPDNIVPEGIPDAITNKVWSRLQVVGTRRAWTSRIIDDDNATREFLYAFQSLLVYLSRACLGMPTDSILKIGNVELCAYGDWEVNAVGADYIECTWRTGNVDPREVTTVHQAMSEDGISKDTINTTYALPNFGLCQMLAPSALSYHAGVMGYKFVVPTDLGDGDLFRIYTMDSFVGIWDDPIPHDDSSTIKVRYWFYPDHAKEGLVNHRLDYPLFVLPYLHEELAPSAAKYTISSTAIAVPHATDNPWVRCYKVNGDGEEYFQIPGAGLIEVRNNGDGTHTSKLDLTAVDMSDTPAAVRLYCMLETSGEDATPSIQNRCTHHVRDASNSWGEVDGASACHTCRLRLAASTFLAGDFDPNGCFDTECNQFTLAGGGPSLATNPALLTQLTKSKPWKLTQTLAGFVHRYVERTGAPSIEELFGTLGQLAEGFHPVVQHMLAAVGYAFRNVSIEDNLIRLDWGSTIMSRYGLPGSKLTDQDTWQKTGNAAATWTREPQYPGDADTQLVQTCQILANDTSAHPYRMQQLGHIGKRQRWREGFQNFFHGLNAAGTSTFRDGTFERGEWVFDGLTYRGKFVLRGVRSNRATHNDWGGSKGNALIDSAYNLGGGKIAFYLENGLWELSSIGGDPQNEIMTIHRGGGINVSLREDMMPMNWACSSSRIGPDHTNIEAGNVGRIDGEDDIHGVYVLDAQACYPGGGAYPSPVRTQPWEPDANQRPYQGRLSGFLAIALSSGRKLQSGTPIVIKRDSAVLGDNLITLTGDTGLDGRKPDELPKDSYWYIEDAESSPRVVYILFSHLNDTASTLDRRMYIDYSTELIDGSSDATSTYPAHDIYTEATQGWNLLKVSLVGVGSTTDVGGVRVIRFDGSEVTLNAAVAIPGHYSGYPTTDYVAVNEGSGQWSFYISPVYAGEILRVDFDIAASGLTQSAWYDANVAIHGDYTALDPRTAQGALPTAWKLWGSNMDRIVVHDYNGELLNASGGNMAWFEGKTLNISSDGVFLDGTMEIEARLGSRTDNALAFGADGLVYLENPDFGDDVLFRATYSCRDWSALAAEVNELPKMLERGLEGGIAATLQQTAAGIFPPYFSLIGQREASCISNVSGFPPPSFPLPIYSPDLQEYWSYSFSGQGESSGNIARATYVDTPPEYMGAILQMLIAPFRVPELDRFKGTSANIADCKANMTIGRARATEIHIIRTVATGDTLPSDYSNVDTNGNTHTFTHAFAAAIGSELSPKKYTVTEEWRSTPATIQLTPLLIGLKFDGAVFSMSLLGVGGIGTQTIANNSSSTIRRYISCAGFARAYMDAKADFTAFTLAMLPSSVPFVAEGYTAAESAEVLFNSLVQSSGEACVKVGENAGDDIYISVFSRTFYDFNWDSFTLDTLCPSFTGDLSIPAEARVMPEYHVSQEEIP